MLTEYAADIHTSCAYPPGDLPNSLGEYMANLGKTQLRIAETEKYAHVTFFFSGGREALFKGETRELIPSPDVATYDPQPEMSAPEVTDKLVAAIKSGDYDLVSATMRMATWSVIPEFQCSREGCRVPGYLLATHQ